MPLASEPQEWLGRPPEETATAPQAADALATLASGSGLRHVMPYVSIARPDHWFKNIFMLLGIILALFYHPEAIRIASAWPILLAVVATCLLASSNYVINEILDAPTDLSHPVKCQRPIPSGRVYLPFAYAEWILLGVAGLSLAWVINRPFFYSGAFLLVMGIVYNVPPLRSKDYPYVDVLSESINNPIRLLLGWFALTSVDLPPVSLLIAYWMVGAFFMAAKRFTEFRSIGDPAVAGAYRASFRYYTGENMLISIVFYAITFALFLGVFIVRYHIELILAFPLVSGFICYYLSIAFKKDSATQSPEQLYRERGLMLYLLVCVIAFCLLMFTNIDAMYHLFHIEPVRVPALWRF